jgi:NADH dehydrogenase
MPHILIIGGGYVGMYTAHRLQKRLRRDEATVTVVDPKPNMTYQPFLAEAAAGSVEARHVVVPLRRVLPKTRVLAGSLTDVDHVRRIAAVTDVGGETTELAYDHLVVAVGSVSRTLPIPGLAQAGIGFTTIGEAIWLRNHVLSRLDAAAVAESVARRKRLLTFVVVGGGYSGVEVFAELQDMARHAMRRYPELDPGHMRWVLVEAADRILPEVSASLASYTVQRLTKRGMEVKLGTRVESMVDGQVVLSDGEQFESDTIVWTAGVRPNPVVAQLGLPTDIKGRLRVTAELKVSGVAGVWAAGDAAAVPDLTRPDDPGALCSPSAQHAVRQASRLADNIASTLRDRPTRAYRHAYAGSVASLGLHKGVAEIYGVKLRGFLAWMLHRVYHLSRVPTLNRKARVVADWTLALLFRRDVVSLDQVQHPREAWEWSNEARPDHSSAAFVDRAVPRGR